MDQDLTISVWFWLFLASVFLLIVIIRRVLDYSVDIRRVEMELCRALSSDERSYWKTEKKALRLSLFTGISIRRARSFYERRQKRKNTGTIVSLLLPSMICTAFTLLCLAGSTWAWFTADFTSEPIRFESASFTLEAAVIDETGGNRLSAQGETFRLSGGGHYRVELSAKGNSKTGYGIMTLDGKAYYTEQISLQSGESRVFVFHLNPSKDSVCSFRGVWGTFSCDTREISEGMTFPIAEKVSAPAETTAPATTVLPNAFPTFAEPTVPPAVTTVPITTAEEPTETEKETKEEFASSNEALSERTALNP